LLLVSSLRIQQQRDTRHHQGATTSQSPPSPRSWPP